jgi:hypothetical protein
MTDRITALVEVLIGTSATLTGLFFIGFRVDRKRNGYPDLLTFLYLFAPFVVGSAAVVDFNSGLVWATVASVIETGAFIWLTQRELATSRFMQITAVSASAVFLTLIGSSILLFMTVYLGQDVASASRDAAAHFVLFMVVSQVMGAVWVLVMYIRPL